MINEIRENIYNGQDNKRVNFKLSPVREDTYRGGTPWAVSSPPTTSPVMRQFEMHPNKKHRLMLTVMIIRKFKIKS